MATEPIDSSPVSSGAALDSSHLRLKAQPMGSRAARRVVNYLRVLGLTDRARLRELSQRIAEEVATGDPERHATRAVAAAQARFDAWRDALYHALPEGVDPLWLRAFVRARPDLFLGDVERAQRAAMSFGEPLAGKGPRRASFRPQQFERARLPRWLMGLSAPALLTLAATYTLWHALSADGHDALQLIWVSLFAFLFFMAAVGFSLSALGYATRSRERRSGTSARAPMATALPRTALVMPIYHESAEDVFAGLAGMRESLAALPEGDAFEIFVLSDSREPEICADEERAFRRVKASSQGVPIYYHRRAHNERHKAGNLAEFFETWGPRYEYAVTLDADSVMSGAALVELIRRMEADIKLGLLQAPITLHRGETLLARALQLSSSVCGPLFTRGLSLWSGAHGNYYGHNAAIRVRAFLDCCALPELEGKPPFGGQVLSHDFVEAALLCRAGWKVRIAHELDGGSYEGLPPTLSEYVARDQRWCQGNLQHLRVAAMHGLTPMSRVHLLLGASGYLAGPLWLVFVAIGALLWRQTGAAFEHVAASLSLATLAVLLGPWLFGLLASTGDAARRRAHGGGLRLALSGLASVLIGALLAPLLMLHHTRIVLSILAGHSVRWGAQRRRASGELKRAVSAELPATFLGACTALWLSVNAQLLLWFSPIWLPWLLAIPLHLAFSSPRLGSWSRRLGLLVVPSESQPEPLLTRIDELRVLTRSDASARFRDLVLDPVLVAAHVARLQSKRGSEPPRRLASLRGRALRQGPASLSPAEWRLLAEDRESMELLHRQAWRCWPVESWDIGRESQEVPPDSLVDGRAKPREPSGH